MTSPKILYTLVAYNGVILVDYAKTKGDFINETRDYVFPKLRDSGTPNQAASSTPTTPATTYTTRTSRA